MARFVSSNDGLYTASPAAIVAVERSTIRSIVFSNMSLSIPPGVEKVGL